MEKPNWMKHFPLGKLKTPNDELEQRMHNTPSVSDPYKRSLLEDHKSGIISKEELVELLEEYNDQQPA